MAKKEFGTAFDMNAINIFFVVECEWGASRAARDKAGWHTESTEAFVENVKMTLYECTARVCLSQRAPVYICGLANSVKSIQ